MIKTKLWRSNSGDLTSVNETPPHITKLTKSMPLIPRPDARSFQSLMSVFVLGPGTRDVEKRRNYRMLPPLAVRQGSDFTSLCYHSK